mgnify:CR=1 FL=1
MEQTEQLKASALMLDMGVAIPVRPFKFLYRKKKPRSVVMRTSGLGNLMRISNLHLQMGITYAEMQEYTFEQNMKFIAEHGITVSRMVAYTLVRSKFWGRLLNRPVAWMLRHWMHPAALEEAWIIVVRMFGTVPFGNIIRLAETINPMSPLLSHGKG